jgi:hypothetical protein
MAISRCQYEAKDIKNGDVGADDSEEVEYLHRDGRSLVTVTSYIMDT